MKNCSKMLWLTTALLTLGATLNGCKDRNSEVRVYRTDKGSQSPETPTVPTPTVSPMLDVPQQSGSAAFDWTLPEGWGSRPGSGMRLVTLMVPAGDTQLECSVIELSGSAGGIVSNVNRWRGQLSLPSAGASEVDASAIKVQGGLGEVQCFKLVNESAPEKAFLAAILPAGSTTLFIKLEAPAAQLGALQESFLSFCKSVKRQ